MRENILTKFYRWFYITEIETINDIDLNNSILGSIVIPYSSLIDTSKYKILIDNNNLLKRITVHFSFKEEYVFKLSKKTLEMYITRGLQKNLDLYLKSKNWNVLWIKDLYIQIFFCKKLYKYTNRLRKLFRMTYTKRQSYIETFASFYIGGYNES